MTLDAWRAVLRIYATDGTATEQMMAKLLMNLSLIDDPRIGRMFDRFASNILEAGGDR